MNKIKLTIAICSLGLLAFAGDTNFVAQFHAIWQTHNASNILAFVEQNVATNKSPETLFARGDVAVFLQEWIPGATNYWEQAIQMIATNEAYSAVGRTNVIKEIRFVQGFTALISDASQPSWDSDSHAFSFSKSRGEAPYLYILQQISTIPLAEPTE